MAHWNLEVFVFEERENRTTRGKISRSEGENQEQTEPAYGFEFVDGWFC